MIPLQKPRFCCIRCLSLENLAKLKGCLLFIKKFINKIKGIQERVENNYNNKFDYYFGELMQMKILQIYFLNLIII